jgi:hypothetical protein
VPRDRQPVVSGLVPWRTEAYVLPQNGLPCVLWALCALAASTPSTLGIARDPLMDQPRISFRALGCMLLRHFMVRSTAAGALTLVRCRGVQHWELLRLRHGCYMFNGWLRRNGISLSHCMGFNAAAGLLFLGPWVEVIEEQDRICLDRTAVRLQAPVDHGALALSSTAPILVSLAGAHRRAVRHLLGRQLQRTPAHAQGRAPPSPRVAVQHPRRGPARPAR